MGARITPVPVPVSPEDVNPSELTPGDPVTIPAKPMSTSLTVMFNGALAVLGVIMAFATSFRTLNFAAAITSNMALQNKINIIVMIATIIIVLISVFNTYLRIFKTKQPIALG